MHLHFPPPILSADSFSVHWDGDFSFRPSADCHGTGRLVGDIVTTLTIQTSQSVDGNSEFEEEMVLASGVFHLATHLTIALTGPMG